MWKIIVALIFAFVGTSKSIESNASLLETKIIDNGSSDDIGVLDDFLHTSLARNEFKFVVSIGEVWEEVLMQKCFGIMISLINALTLFNCGSEWVPRNTRYYDGSVDKLYVSASERGNPDKKFYLIERFLDLDKYMEHCSGKKKSPTTLAVIELKEQVQFLSTPSQYPVYGNEINVLGGIMVGLNQREQYSSPQPKFLKADVTVVEDSFNKKDSKFENRFVAKLSRDCLALSAKDVGAPVFFNEMWVGVLLDYKKNIFIKVFPYKKYIDKVITSESPVPQQTKKDFKRYNTIL